MHQSTRFLAAAFVTATLLSCANDTAGEDNLTSDANEAEPDVDGTGGEVPEGCPTDLPLGDGSALCADYRDYLCNSVAWLNRTNETLGLSNVGAAYCVAGGSDFGDDGSSSATACWLHERRGCTVPWCVQSNYDELIACSLGELTPETCKTCTDEEVVAAKTQRACQAALRRFVQFCNEAGPGGFECPTAACTGSGTDDGVGSDPNPASTEGAAGAAGFEDPSSIEDTGTLGSDPQCVAMCEKDLDCASGDFASVDECVASCEELLVLGGDCEAALRSLQLCAAPLDCEAYLSLATQEPENFPCASEYVALQSACGGSASMDDPAP